MAWLGFVQRNTFAVNSTNTTERGLMVAIADINGDGKPDIICTKECSYISTTCTVSSLLGNGDGTFQAEQTISTIFDPAFPVIADVNGDGKPDVLCSYYKGIACWLGNGDGTFQTPPLTKALPNWPVQLAVGDINGDGKPDLVTGYSGGTRVIAMVGNGNGTFQNPTTIGTLAVAPVGRTVLADLDGDGNLDVVVGAWGTNGIGAQFMMGNGNGTFKSPQTLGPGRYTARVAVADVNGDGRPDIIAFPGYGANAAFVGVCWLGNGNGTFQAGKTFTLNDRYNRPGGCSVADINGDGMPDLVLCSGTVAYSGKLSYMLGNGDGTFQAQKTLPTDAEPSSSAVADLNGDGVPDLVVGVMPGTNNSPVKNVEVFLNAVTGRGGQVIAA